MRIGIIGMGAIGGYISAMLCKSNQDVYVIAKGETLKNIKNNGITLKNEEEGNFTVFPTLVTDNAEDAGIMDIVFVCVKGYSLKAAAKTISPMIHDHTLVVPIIDGVDGGSKLYSQLGKGKIVDAVMYITSKVVGNGVLNHTSKSAKIVISENRNRSIYKIYLELIYNVLTQANIICEIRKDAEVFAWNKYVFNCAFNITDSYYDVRVKGILDDKMKFETFCNVAKECEEVGRTKGIKLPENIYERTINNLKKLSKKSMSSMHRDVILGRKFELELFCGDLCRMGKAVGVPTPYTQKAYEKLKILQPAN
ncbi:2-dehydropantoate 2-reductase [Clostridium sp.]|uniref:ketopantoate reductase family protein n=1 Tax=Clostridium sp. TaxID=1506 RepID=UPI0028411CE3|nr:2-dehydropantoate 2-reductase [Clostridium sp.]MDR3593628.1 2-dehydropantoate 2-reductase [Clostridium sp.]